MKQITKHLFASALMVSLSACSSFFDKDNTPLPTPLVNFKTQANVKPLWYAQPGSSAKNNYLKLSPAIANSMIFTASRQGIVAANDLTTGKSLWQVHIKADISSGVAAYGNLIYVGTREGEIVALDQTNGQIRWKATSSSEILAPAAASDRVTLVKTIDGRITAFATSDGRNLWQYQQTEPNLILRGSSAPQISRGAAIVGFENGELAKLNLQTGYVQWQKTIAEPKGLFAIQRMVDIDADPIILGNHVYAATYQGRIASLDFDTGNELWSHDISSYAGIASDGSKVYVSDAQSHIWAFNAATGAVNWEQKDLAARNITGPAVIGNSLVVGDAEGYLHWIDKQSGRFVARILVNSSGILATPVVNNHVVYVYTKDGHLAAYTVD